MHPSDWWEQQSRLLAVPKHQHRRIRVSRNQICRRKTQKPGEPPPGAPPAFGTAPAVGPQVSTSTFAEAEKLVQVEMTPADRAQAADSWRTTMASLYERRTGPKKVELESTLAPASRWDPVLPGEKAAPQRDQFVWTKADPGPLPAKRRGSGLCACYASRPLDRKAPAHFRENHAALS